jgi:SP family sugar:H+ symporter-like MFS transporter
MDRVDRKTMLAWGAAVMAVSLAALALALSRTADAGEMRLDRGAAMAALVAINIFAVAFGVTWGPITWLMLGELFDTRLRTTAVAVATACNWVTNWAVTHTFPLLAEAGLGIAYGLYAGFACLALFFVLKFLPETRGRALS